MKKMILVLLAASFALTGCMSTLSTSNGMLSYGSIEGTERGSFTASEGYIYILHPSFMVLGDNPAAELDTVIGPELQSMDANAARDLTIKDGFTFIDFLLSGIVPLVSWGTVEVSGTAVQQQ